MSQVAALQDRFKGSSIGQWFYGRERSDQRIIAAVVALVLLSVLWLGVWKPVADWREIEQNRHMNAQNLVEWLKANEAAAKSAARNPSTQRGGRALIPVITKAAQAHSIRVNRLQPESNGVISVVLEAQSFNQIISWVSQLHENNGVSVERASFDELDTPGFVNAQLRLN